MLRNEASTRDSSLRQRVRAACRFATQRVRSTLREASYRMTLGISFCGVL
ncbi:hypothetical protein [Brunnivagina elsteri]|nr:hypothetical protein [Calothrix elsteri]